MYREYVFTAAYRVYSGSMVSDEALLRTTLVPKGQFYELRVSTAHGPCAVMLGSVYTCGSLGSRVAVCDAVRPTFNESVPANRRKAVPAARAIASGAR